MNRRHFFATLFGAGVAATVAPTLLAKTDTVPVMLSPGEAVVPLRRILHDNMTVLRGEDVGDVIIAHDIDGGVQVDFRTTRADIIAGQSIAIVCNGCYVFGGVVTETHLRDPRPVYDCKAIDFNVLLSRQKVSLQPMPRIADGDIIDAKYLNTLADGISRLQQQRVMYSRL